MASLGPLFEPGDALLFDHLMLHRTGIRHVGNQDFGCRPRTHGRTFAGGFIQCRAIATDQRHIGAVPAELDGDGPADTATRPSDEGDLLVEAHAVTALRSFCAPA